MKTVLKILVWLASPLLAQGSDTLRLDTFYRYYDASAFASFFVDSSNSLTFEEVQKQHFSKKFNPPDYWIRHSYWVKLHVTIPDSAVLSLFPNFADYIDLYLPVQGMGYQHEKRGRHYSSIVQPYEAYFPFQYIFYNDSADYHRPIYFKVQNFTYGSGVSPPFEFGAEVYPKSAPIVYIAPSFTESWFYLIFVGILAFLTIYFFFYFFFNQQKIFLLYSAYLAALFLYYFNRMNAVQSFHLAHFPVLSFFINENTQIIAGALYFAFVRHFLEIPKTIPNLDPVFRWTINGHFLLLVFLNLLILILPYNPLHFQVLFLQKIAIVLISLYIMGYLLIKKRGVLVWISVASGGLLLLGNILALILNQMMILQYFALPEVLLLALGLGYLVRQNDLERLQTKEALIEQLKINEQIQKEMQEKLIEEVRVQTEKAVQKTQEAARARAAEMTSNFQQELEKIKMKALQAQMNPHFLFNCLNSIRLFYLKNEIEKADSYITKFSRLLRLILNHSRADFITLQEELDALQLYIEFEQMRFNDKFEFEIAVEKDVNLHEIRIQPLIIQPFVENAIWHGLMQSHQKGNLSINVSRQNGHILIVVQDNGIGRINAQLLKKEQANLHQSFGLSITKERMELMKQSLQKEARFQVIDLINNVDALPEGTRVEILYEI